MPKKGRFKRCSRRLCCVSPDDDSSSPSVSPREDPKHLETCTACKREQNKQRRKNFFKFWRRQQAEGLKCSKCAKVQDSAGAQPEQPADKLAEGSTFTETAEEPTGQTNKKDKESDQYVDVDLNSTPSNSQEPVCHDSVTVAISRHKIDVQPEVYSWILKQKYPIEDSDPKDETSSKSDSAKLSTASAVSAPISEQASIAAEPARRSESGGSSQISDLYSPSPGSSLITEYSSIYSGFASTSEHPSTSSRPRTAEKPKRYQRRVQKFVDDINAKSTKAIAETEVMYKRRKPPVILHVSQGAQASASEIVKHTKVKRDNMKSLKVPVKKPQQFHPPRQRLDQHKPSVDPQPSEDPETDVTNRITPSTKSDQDTTNKTEIDDKPKPDPENEPLKDPETDVTRNIRPIAKSGQEVNYKTKTYNQPKPPSDLKDPETEPSKDPETDVTRIISHITKSGQKLTLKTKPDNQPKPLVEAKGPKDPKTEVTKDIRHITKSGGEATVKIKTESQPKPPVHPKPLVGPSPSLDKGTEEVMSIKPVTKSDPTIYKKAKSDNLIKPSTSLDTKTDILKKSRFLPKSGQEATDKTKTDDTLKWVPKPLLDLEAKVTKNTRLSPKPGKVVTNKIRTDGTPKSSVDGEQSLDSGTSRPRPLPDSGQEVASKTKAYNMPKPFIDPYKLKTKMYDMPKPSIDLHLALDPKPSIYLRTEEVEDTGLLNRSSQEATTKTRADENRDATVVDENEEGTVVGENKETTSFDYKDMTTADENKEVKTDGAADTRFGHVFPPMQLPMASWYHKFVGGGTNKLFANSTIESQSFRLGVGLFEASARFLHGKFKGTDTQEPTKEKSKSDEKVTTDQSDGELMAAAAAAPSSASETNEGKLISLGFSKSQVSQALKTMDNDVERAAEWLFSGSSIDATKTRSYGRVSYPRPLDLISHNIQETNNRRRIQPLTREECERQIAVAALEMEPDTASVASSSTVASASKVYSGMVEQVNSVGAFFSDDDNEDDNAIQTTLVTADCRSGC